MESKISSEKSILQSIKKRNNKMKVVGLLCTSLLLQGCQASPLFENLVEDFVRANNHQLTKNQIHNLWLAIDKNENLLDSEKEMLKEFFPVFETLSRVDYNSIKEEFEKLDIVKTNFSNNLIEGTWNDLTKELKFSDEIAINHELFHLLSGHNNGNFMEEAITALLDYEYFGNIAYPKHIIIAQMFCEIFGGEFVLQSYMSNKNLLKEKIARTVDTSFADIFFDLLEDYQDKYKNSQTIEDLLQVEKSFSVILNYIEVIYKCKTNVTLEKDSLLNPDLSESQSEHLTNLLFYKDQLLNHNGYTQVGHINYFDLNDKNEKILKR